MYAKRGRKPEMSLEFRPLEADEIECRVGQIAKNGSGLSLLLYKTSRVDGDILDETVGAENWQCEYDVINGQLFCTVSIWDEGKSQWIRKQDVGSPSNVEAEKGRSSDALKRACFRWGIGKELYSSPRIWVYAQNRDGTQNCNISQGQNGKYQCYDPFSVDSIEIRDHEIVSVSIRNDNTGRVVFYWSKAGYQSEARTGEPANAPSREQLEELSGLVSTLASSKGVSNDEVIKGLMNSKSVKSSGVVDGEIRTSRQASIAIGQLKTWIGSAANDA